MADVKISALPLASTPLAGTEVLPIVQSATTDQVSVANLTAGRAVSAASLTLTTTPLAVSSGGTGLTSLTAGYIPYASSSSALSFSSGLYSTGTNIGIGTTSPLQPLVISNSGAAGIEISPTATGSSPTIVCYNRSSSAYVQLTTHALLHDWTVSGTQAMRLDAVGNLGLGVTPSAWVAGAKSFEIGTVGFGFSSGYGNGLNFGANAYYDGAFKYGVTSAASRYAQAGGVHAWYNAPSGTAGSAITFTQAMTLDASGNLAVGGSTPNARLDVQGGSLRVNEDGAGTKVITLRSNYASVGPAINVTTNDPLLFLTNNTERARFNAGAPILCLSGGSTTATGTGIAFPATQSASTDVNTLDDYEEGDWTPVYSGSSTGGSCTYGTRQGKYRKIGSYVYFQCYIITTSTHSGTGTLVVGGLPIAPLSGIYGGGATAVYKYQFVTNGPDFAQLEPSNSNLYLRKNNNTGQTDIAPSVLQNGTELMLFGCYLASA